MPKNSWMTLPPPVVNRSATWLRYQTTNAASGSEQFIEFTYKGDSKEPTDFVALWTENLSFGTAAAPVVSSYKYNEASKTGTGTIKYKLGTVDKTWREGIIYLTDKKHGLNRNIHLYSINEVQYQETVETPRNKCKCRSGIYLYRSCQLPEGAVASNREVCIGRCSSRGL